MLLTKNAVMKILNNLKNLLVRLWEISILIFCGFFIKNFLRSTI